MTSYPEVIIIKKINLTTQLKKLFFCEKSPQQSQRKNDKMGEKIFATCVTNKAIGDNQEPGRNENSLPNGSNKDFFKKIFID